MKVVATFHPPSSVTSSLRCTLSTQSELGHLVIAKANRVEVSSITAEGLKHECSLEVWGRILSIKAVPAKDNGVSNILVLLDHPQPKLLLLEYKTDADVSVLETIWFTDLHTRLGQQAEFLNGIVISTAGDVAVVSCYKGKLKVIHFEDGKVSKDFEVIVPELNLMAMAILEGDEDDNLTIALLHLDHRQRIQLLGRDLDMDALELSTNPSFRLIPSILPSSSFPDPENPLTLVPVPAFPLSRRSTDSASKSSEFLGGVLIIGGRKIMLIEQTSDAEQEKQQAKARRQDRRKSSGDTELAKAKEKERENKKIKARASVKWPWSDVTACCPADDDGRRFFIGDMYGRLALLTIGEAPELILLPVGEISAPTTLTYLSSQVLYVGSHDGDSQLVRIHATPQERLDTPTLLIPSGIQTVSPTALSADAAGPSSLDADEDVEMHNVDNREGKGGRIVALKGTFIEVLDRHRNLAPITDAILADMDESGQPQIVTSCGGASSGALNVVRTGADFQELAVLKGIPNVTNIFPIRNRYEAEVDTHILLSTLYESYLLRVDSRDTLVQVDPSSTSLVTDQPTLALLNIPKRLQRVGPAGVNTGSHYPDSAYIVQVTPAGINLLDYDATLRTFNHVGGGWSPEPGPRARPRDIVAASLNASQFVVALSGGTLVLLNLGFNGQLQVVKTREFGEEISAISCAPLDPSQKYSRFIAVAFWNSNVIKVLSLKDEQSYLNPIVESVPLPALPRSVVLHNFGDGHSSKDPDYRPHVLAGLVDGTVASFSLQGKQLRDLKFFSLGNTPVSLSVSTVDGKRAVFASGSRTAVFYWDRQRLRQSFVMLKDVSIGASLNTAHFASCQVLATSSSLHIGQIRGVDKLQIRSIPLGYEVPSRIAYHPGYNVLGVATLRLEPTRIGECDIERASFILFDGATFDRISGFECEPDEEITSALSLDASGISTPASFCVGVVRKQAGEGEPTLGRIVLFDVAGPMRELRRIASEPVRGCVYAVVAIKGMIAAAVNTAVNLYCVVQEGEKTKLTQVASWNHNYFVISLVASGDKLIVGDAIASVTVLKVDGTSLVTEAKDYASLFPISIQATRNTGIIGCNIDANLFTFTTQALGASRRLERDGNYHFGEVITKFLPGGLSVQDNHESHMFESEHLFFTTSGRIGVILHVNDEVSLSLTALQRNMAAVIQGPGDMQHTKWRAPSNVKGHSDAEPSFGFLDGDFLEQFLTHTEANKILKGSNQAERIDLSKEEVENILEKLQSLH